MTSRSSCFFTMIAAVCLSCFVSTNGFAQVSKGDFWEIKSVKKNHRNYLVFELSGKTLKTYNLNKLTGKDNIETLNILGTKKVNNIYFVLFTYEYPSVNNNGQGYCGAGNEGFMALIHINKKLQLTRFEKHQAYSCINNIDTVKFIYDVKHPEYGIKLPNR
ncbi:hypothetical protein [Mucilaginibacter lappiensis]|uniref:Uncharacterized protein n=1 Tax=Mucilaginibacter lappiensis TaxID=354630 RepID=A0A841JLC1_9SPHI|nr:hypothetical protein [Mucilaginibacter lappiensis]MBB6129165.1 hypothetical protein [Mucilaginibacter lappiensis]